MNKNIRNVRVVLCILCYQTHELYSLCLPFILVSQQHLTPAGTAGITLAIAVVVLLGAVAGYLYRKRITRPPKIDGCYSFDNALYSAGKGRLHSSFVICRGLAPKPCASIHLINLLFNIQFPIQL